MQKKQAFFFFLIRFSEAFCLLFVHLFNDPEIDVDRGHEKYRDHKCCGDEISDQHCRRSDEGENEIYKKIGVASREVFQEVEKIHFCIDRCGEIDSFDDAFFLFEPECEREYVCRSKNRVSWFHQQ